MVLQRRGGQEELLNQPCGMGWWGNKGLQCCIRLGKRGSVMWTALYLRAHRIMVTACISQSVALRPHSLGSLPADFFGYEQLSLPSDHSNNAPFKTWVCNPFGKLFAAACVSFFPVNYIQCFLARFYHCYNQLPHCAKFQFYIHPL